ncbi:Uma2 family endonuclease [Actinosynnema sp. NPDC050436]|uniref:Uma2 family endonuclease n=1 Tax=Actinosynnema sp. NPDC050436 TaxID=3155659 RepID=UPI003403A954
MSAAPEHGYEWHHEPYPAIGPHTVEDWLDLPPTADGSRIELILGYPHVTPPPSGKHRFAMTRLIRPVEDALTEAARADLYAVCEVNVEIPTAFRTALVPDVVILNRPPTEVSFPAGDLALAVEIWSPGNTLAEREFKVRGYAGAGVPFFWAVDQPSELSELKLTAYRLDNGKYVEENVLKPGDETTITAAPVPVTLDAARLVI